MNNILGRIHRSALKFLLPMTQKEAYETIVNEANKLVSTKNGSIFLPDPETGKLERVFTSNPKLYPIKIRKKGITYTTFKYQAPTVIAKTELLHRIQPKFREMGIKSIISIPLTYKGKSIGVLSLQSLKNEYFSRKELDVLKIFGSFASLAIRNTQLYDEIKSALESRDLFISMTVHELRTPLTSISGYSQMLSSKFAKTNTPESRWIKDLSWEAIRLTNLINELLEANRMKSGQFQFFFSECDLQKIVERALSEFRFTHPYHQIKFDNKSSGVSRLIGDSTKILQMIVNLLDNAAKFSPVGSEIIIGLKSSQRHLRLSIKDQGKGISNKDRLRIFEKFYQGNNHTAEGMGLGLFLVKNIIKQHHGAIQIKSKENKGTAVLIKLPILKKYGH